jgi:hypothetical protein
VAAHAGKGGKLWPQECGLDDFVRRAQEAPMPSVLPGPSVLPPQGGRLQVKADGPCSSPSSVAVAGRTVGPDHLLYWVLREDVQQSLNGAGVAAAAAAAGSSSVPPQQQDGADIWQWHSSLPSGGEAEGAATNGEGEEVRTHSRLLSAQGKTVLRCGRL